jgi:hypothetical protein
LGINVNADGFAKEYEAAVQDAFKLIPSEYTHLKSVKAFKEYKLWPQILGISSMVLGSVLAGSNPRNPVGGVVLYLGGAFCTGINSYDLVIIGEPAK